MFNVSLTFYQVLGRVLISVILRVISLGGTTYLTS
jgi:hypothetical protein